MAFYTVDGITYVFNREAFRWQYDKVGSSKRGRKTEIKEQIAELGYDRNTIEGWIKKKHGPSDLKTVRYLEDILGAPVGSFLTPRTKSTQKNNMEENMMREIKDYERDAARKLYAEMCGMIDGLEYFPEEFTKATHLGTPEGFKYLGREPFPFMYRDNLIQNVRKVGFDLPKRTRDQLIDFIFDAFGDGCYERGMMYFESQAYKDYLEKKGLENNDDVRDSYSVWYIGQLYERLDAIFADYLCVNAEAVI